MLRGKTPMNHQYWIVRSGDLAVQLQCLANQATVNAETQEFIIHVCEVGQPCSSTSNSKTLFGEIRGKHINIFEKSNNGGYGRSLVDYGSIQKNGELSFNSQKIWEPISPPLEPVMTPPQNVPSVRQTQPPVQGDSPAEMQNLESQQAPFDYRASTCPPCAKPRPCPPCPAPKPCLPTNCPKTWMWVSIGLGILSLLLLISLLHLLRSSKKSVKSVTVEKQKSVSRGQSPSPTAAAVAGLASDPENPRYQAEYSVWSSSQ